jgi:hypothetical protein
MTPFPPGKRTSHSIMAQAQITIADVEKTQSELMELVAQLSGTTDSEKLQVLGRKIQQVAARLQEMSMAWRAGVRAAAGLDPNAADAEVDGISTVVLTARQQKMVVDDTGLVLTEVDLEGPVWPMTLPSVNPRTVDHAILAAARQKAQVQQAASPARSVIDKIQNGDNDRLKEQLAGAMKDPGFLAGALNDN